MKTDLIVVFVTASSVNQARRIADTILKKKLAACANIISGIDSAFWWKGRIDRAKEVLIILKTRSKKFKYIEKEVKRIHSYEIPEIIAIPIFAGSKDYLGWIKDVTGP